MPSQKQLKWRTGLAAKGALLPDGNVALVMDRETAKAMLGIYDAAGSELEDMARIGCENFGCSFTNVNDGSIFYVLSKLLRDGAPEWEGDL